MRRRYAVVFKWALSLAVESLLNLGTSALFGSGVAGGVQKVDAVSECSEWMSSSLLPIAGIVHVRTQIQRK